MGRFILEHSIAVSSNRVRVCHNRPDSCAQLQLGDCLAKSGKTAADMTQVEVPKIFVHALPRLIPAGALRGGVAVVVDVLRATTVMARALASGCREIIPCAEIDEARAVATCVPPGTALLTGERGGLPIEGFDLGNAPEEFTPEVCRDKTIVMTTTNGTRAILASLEADHVYVAAFVNLQATVDEILVQFLKREHRHPIHIVCAGSDGQTSLEDNLLAGALAARLAEQSFEVLGGEIPGFTRWNLGFYQNIVLQGEHQPHDAFTAVSAWKAVEKSLPEYPLAEVLASDHGGRNLLRIGRGVDIEAAAKIDSLDVVGKLGRKPTRISRV
jgi:2-phosphosulfolactate phosphatase